MEQFMRVWIAVLVSLTMTTNPGEPFAQSRSQQSLELEQKIKQAVKEIARWSPNKFTKLPEEIRRELVSEGCTVPQPSLAKNPMNVIHGQFARKGQTDWAVLCSRDLQSKLVIFWGGSARCAAGFEFEPDAASMFGFDNGVIYDRRITNTGPRTMRKEIYESAEYFHQEPAFLLDHDGILDGTDKGAHLFYCNSNGWHSWGFFE